MLIWIGGFPLPRPPGHQLPWDQVTSQCTLCNSCLDQGRAVNDSDVCKLAPCTLGHGCGKLGFSATFCDTNKRDREDVGTYCREGQACLECYFLIRGCIRHKPQARRRAARAALVRVGVFCAAHEEVRHVQRILSTPWCLACIAAMSTLFMATIGRADWLGLFLSGPSTVVRATKKEYPQNRLFHLAVKLVGGHEPHLNDVHQRLPC